MRVFCPQHKIGFFTPRRNPIRCENRGHVLGEFNLHDDAKVPVETLWQYCCNCEHFCPVELDQGGLEACPACGRRISQRYMCDRCFTVSLESTTPIQTKNFTLTSDGTPQPSCPGCFQETSADLREHDCEKLGAHFRTALTGCPACLEQLDVGPVFPCSVAQYLKRTNAAHKRIVTFDYATGLFVPLDNGEFVLLSSSSENSRLIVLPRSARFESKRDFYELYQDYYHCANVDAGEVHIIEPAVVERVRDGWKLQSMGVLEIVDAQPGTEIVANGVATETEFSARERSALFSANLIEDSPVAIEKSPAAVVEKPAAEPCANCGSLVQTGYAFCWKCGQPSRPDAVPSKKVTEAAASHRILVDDDESTIHQDVGHIQPLMFSSALSERSETSPTLSLRLKLIAVIAIGLLLVTLGVFLLKGPVSQLGHTGDTQQVTASLQATADMAPRVEPTADVPAETKTQTTRAIDRAEEELRKLRERRIASLSDRLTILQLFASTEKQYPNDYRFPYERAKLAINGRETKSHDDAFKALSLAAEEAIRTGKAQEMLESLQVDKIGDFHKLSHGHREWIEIIEALKRKDATLLTLNYF